MIPITITTNEMTVTVTKNGINITENTDNEIEPEIPWNQFDDDRK